MPVSSFYLALYFCPKAVLKVVIICVKCEKSEICVKSNFHASG